MDSEFKLRAWDKKKNEMSETFDIWQIDQDNSYRTYLPGLGRVYEEDVILMLYIGFKDKKGKEIYEGDIIRKYYLGDDCKPDYDNYLDSVVKFNILTEIFGVPHGDKTGLCEIVGNIYENPELIKNARR